MDSDVACMQCMIVSVSEFSLAKWCLCKPKHWFSVLQFLVLCMNFTWFDPVLLFFRFWSWSCLNYVVCLCFDSCFWTMIRISGFFPIKFTMQTYITITFNLENINYPQAFIYELLGSIKQQMSCLMTCLMAQAFFPSL